MAQKHIIMCAARTGSTMLRHVINDHTNCINYGEIFKLWRTLHFFRHIKVVKDFGSPLKEVQGMFDRDKIEFFNRYVFGSKEGKQSIGFKFKTDEFYNPHFSESAKIIKEDKGIKVIHLKRRDLFQQYVSLMTVLNNDMPKFYIKRQVKSDIKQLNIRVSHFDEFLQNIIERERGSDKVMELHPMKEIWYEDLLSHPVLKFKELFEFLHVDYQDISFKTSKIISDHTALVLNLEELYNYAMESKYQERLDSLVNLK